MSCSSSISFGYCARAAGQFTLGVVKVAGVVAAVAAAVTAVSSVIGFPIAVAAGYSLKAKCITVVVGLLVVALAQKISNYLFSDESNDEASSTAPASAPVSAPVLGNENDDGVPAS